MNSNLAGHLLSKADCVFCDYSGPSEVLADYDDVFVIEPLYPVTEGHVLAIPRRHVEHALASPVLAGRVMVAATTYAAERHVGDCNIIANSGPAATQTIRHLHLHIVPRREHDGLALPWTHTHGRVDVEALSARLHDIYQAEAHRRGDVRHADAYADLSDEVKEWDRVLARWVLRNWRPVFHDAQELPPP